MVLHIECRSLQRAEELVKLAMSAGFRNSGMITGTRYMVQIRHTMHLDAPVAVWGQTTTSTSTSTLRPRPLVSVLYLKVLLELGNQKMKVNQRNIVRLQYAIQDLFASHTPSPPS